MVLRLFNTFKKTAEGGNVKIQISKMLVLMSVNEKQIAENNDRTRQTTSRTRMAWAYLHRHHYRVLASVFVGDD